MLEGEDNNLYWKSLTDKENLIKLHIGCGLCLKEDYINIDSETKDEILKRYQGSDNIIFKNYQEQNIEIFNYDIFNLPFIDNSVDEILCSAFLEHLDFIEERKFFYEVKRILKKGGLFKFSVPDFEWIVKKWIGAKENWKDFWYTDKGEYWFGHGDRNMNSRWGYLTAAIFGNQGSRGQYHKNAFTRKKIEKILDHLDFEIIDFNTTYYRGKFEKTLNYSSKKL